ncbi:MAG TPA: CsbD family protein [Sphingomicrobium sp.]|nr:CsbD family protein [Sphingomicrobium sp.]
MGKLKDKVKGNLNEAAGKVKQQSADPATRDQGRGQELKGKGQQFKGAVKGALGDDI